jgi:4-methyl-5(b-hydroxyethyl)-thiazole monophosphate biosynthesis
VIDVLRRAGVEVIVAGIDGQPEVNGSHGIVLHVDAQVTAVAPEDLDMVVLPGGMPGSANLAASPAVIALLRRLAAAGRYTAAICAAPIALQAAGLLTGKRVTVYPSFEAQLSGATCTAARVERDGTVITGRGPGAALEFALTLVEALGQPDTAQDLRRGMIVAA